MVKRFTYCISSGCKGKVDYSSLRRYEASPSQRSIDNILAFDRAYHSVDLKKCKEKDIILN